MEIITDTKAKFGWMGEIASLNHSVLRPGRGDGSTGRPVVMADTFLANVTLGRDVSEAQCEALETV